MTIQDYLNNLYVNFHSKTWIGSDVIITYVIIKYKNIEIIFLPRHILVIFWHTMFTNVSF